MRADLLLVEGNPVRDMTDTRNIVAVWKKGDIMRPLPRSSRNTTAFGTN
jgi:imidazolonepropionase-like amidohydrolase